MFDPELTPPFPYVDGLDVNENNEVQILHTYIQSQLRSVHKSRKLTPLRLKLLAYLNASPLMSLLDLSKNLGISLQAVSRHLNELRRCQILRYCADINYNLLNLVPIFLICPAVIPLKSSYTHSTFVTRGASQWVHYFLLYPRNQLPIIVPKLKPLLRRNIFQIMATTRTIRIRFNGNPNQAYGEKPPLDLSAETPSHRVSHTTHHTRISSRDVHLLTLLSKNFKQSRQSLAAKLQVSLTSLSNRINRLVREGFLTPYISVDNIGFEETSLFLFRNKLKDPIMRILDSLPITSSFLLQEMNSSKIAHLFKIRAPIGTSILLESLLSKYDNTFEMWTAVKNNLTKFDINPNLFRSSSQSWRGDRLILHKINPRHHSPVLVRGAGLEPANSYERGS